MHRKCLCLSACLVFALARVSIGGEDATLRRPVDLAIDPSSQRIFVANRDSGTVSILDAAGTQIGQEVLVGGRLTSVVALNSGRILVTDAERHELISVELHDEEWRPAQRLSLPRNPMNILWDAEEQTAWVASSWGRVLSSIALNSDTGEFKIQSQIQLPFEPLELLELGSGKLLVASQFAAELAVVDMPTEKLDGIRALVGHNIRGLAVTPARKVLIALQEINSLANSTFDDVHWGNLISNNLLVFSETRLLEAFTDPSVDLQQQALTYLLGEPGNAAGDPGACVVLPDETLAVLLSGVNEVGIFQLDDLSSPPERHKVGKRPVAMVASGNKLLIANQFSESLSVVNLPAADSDQEIALGSRGTPSLAQVGEELFFDSRLSHDGWMSCHSCHTDGHSPGLLNDNLSDGSLGTPKRIPSLLGVADTGPWAWTGRIERLEQQVVNSIEKTMHGQSPTDQQVDALSAYLKSLPGFREVSEEASAARDDEHDALIDRGKALFSTLSCNTCHAAPTFTSPKAYAVGIADEAGLNEFNPPSLIGVGHRKWLFHDGRATSLASVFREHHHPLEGHSLTDDELTSLTRYLESL